MKKKISLLICLGLSIINVGCVNQSQEMQQVAQEVSIVSTSVTICEILDAMQVENVIGIPASTSYTIPKRYEEAISVGAPMNPDIEILASLNPTYILSPKSLESDLGVKYDNAKLSAYFMDLSSTKSMYESIIGLGELLDEQGQAQMLKDEFASYMKDYQENAVTSKQPKVLLLMGLPGTYVVATDKSYAGSLVALAGGENVYDDDKEAFLNINPEDMLSKNPDVILLTSHALPEQVKKMFEDEFSNNTIWSRFQAVQEERVYTLNNEKFGMSANFQYQEALQDLQEIFYEK